MKSLHLLSSASLSLALFHHPREDSSCCFGLVSVGGVNDTLQEAASGALQASGTSADAFLCIEGSSFVDSSNLTLGVTSDNALQCSSAATTASLTLSNNYGLLHDGDAAWYACSGTDGAYNIMAAATDDADCESITLTASGFSCAALGSTTLSVSASTTMTLDSSSTVAATTTSSANVSTTATAAACPSDIAGGVFAPPHLIVPVSSVDPDVAFGNSYDVTITPDNTTLLNFDIPYTGTCALVFEFPWADEEDANSGGYEFSGLEEEIEEDGGLDFALLSAAVTTDTTYNNMPAIATDYGKTQIQPGTNYTIATFDCTAGTVLGYSIASVNNVVLEFFQDSAPEAIGLYVVPCS